MAIVPHKRGRRKLFFVCYLKVENLQLCTDQKT